MESEGVAVRAARLAALTLVLLLTLTAAGYPSASFRDAVWAARRAAQSSHTVKDIMAGGKALQEVNPSSLSSSQQALRQRWLTTLDQNLEQILVAAALQRAANADRQAAQLAPVTAESALRQKVYQSFLDSLKEQTREAIKSAACDQILNALAPDQRTQANPSWSGAHIYAADASGILAKSWAPASVRQAVDWSEWSQKVVKDGQQVARAVEANPGDYVYLGRPPVQRGVIAYTKYCYSLPRPR
jgi:hypothetical protein